MGTQRILPEKACAVQAFEQGGGGKKAEALRALAEAKAAAKAAAKAGSGQAKSTEESAASQGGPDPRHPQTCPHAGCMISSQEQEDCQTCTGL